MIQPPDMEDCCKYIEQAVSDSQQVVFLQLGGWALGKKLTPSHYKRTSLLNRALDEVWSGCL